MWVQIGLRREEEVRCLLVCHCDNAGEGGAVCPRFFAFRMRNVSLGSAGWVAQGGDRIVSIVVIGSTLASVGRAEL